eukprot:6135235-Amphidinium_carterae.9
MNLTSKPTATVTRQDAQQQENQRQQKQNSTPLVRQSTIVIYVGNFLHELSFTTDDKLVPDIYTDSSSAKFLTQQLGFTERTKHIDIRSLHVQQAQSEGELKIHKVSTENNPSNLMTKYLVTAKIKKHSETIGLHACVGRRGTINMISIKPPNIRSRGRCTSGPRATTPQPHMRVHPRPHRPNIESATFENYEILQHELLQEAAQDDPSSDDPYGDYNNHGQERTTSFSTTTKQT